MLTPNQLAESHLWLVPKAAATHISYKRLHHEDREDTLARAKVYLVEAAHRYQPGPVEFSTYAFHSIRSRLYRQKTAQRQPKVEYNSDNPALEQAAHEVVEPTSGLENKNLIDDFRRCLLEHVSERDAEIYIVALMGTETYATMATRYGITRQRVEQIVRHISGVLKKTRYAKAVPFVTRRFQRNR